MRVVGLGVTAFPRTGLVGLIDDYRIVAISETSDLDDIRKEIEVVTAKGMGAGRFTKLNTLCLLQRIEVQNYLKSLPEIPDLFVYKSSKRIEKIANSMGMRVLTNIGEVRDKYEDKWTFRQLASRAGIEVVMGEQMEIEELNEVKFVDLQNKLGKRLVFQITDYSKGGGIGTFFVEDIDKLRRFHEYVENRRRAGRDLKRVNVTRMVEGESASITGCVTKYGVLTSLVQRQIIDVREVVGFESRNGVFCGHDWGERYGEEINKRAKKLCMQVGEMMGKDGYKGIFGIDLVVNRERNEVALIECNSRHTACFPVYSMMQRKAGLQPMELYHVWEHKDVNYEMDFEGVQRCYDQPLYGAQLVLHNLEKKGVKVWGEIRGGVYKTNDGGVEWVRPGWSYMDLVNDNELVLTDGVPLRGARIKAGGRIGRVIFKRPVLMDDRNELLPEIKQAMISLYQKYNLRAV